MPTNILFIGYGSIAREHIRAISQLQTTPEGRDIRFYGVMGRDAQQTESLAREFGMPLATTNLDTALADPSVDVVVVTSPTDLHAEQTEKALNAGKHVLCEIPIAT